MLKRFSHFIASILLVLMPMQALATANMLVCNSIMQSNAAKQSAPVISSTMPCHQHMINPASESNDKSSCKSICASICASLCALTAMPVLNQLSFALNLMQIFDVNHQNYASITQPSLQRPPITFI
ncbi:MAG: hypothetical protein V4605_01510 [Pseudomonadota bacterium]